MARGNEYMTTKKKLFVVIPFFSLILAACGATVDYSNQLLDPNDPSKGTLIWEDTEWKLQCSSPYDYAYVGGTEEYSNENLDQIRENESDTCAGLADTIDVDGKFTEEGANAEVAAYIAVNPDDAVCAPFIKYRVGKSAYSKAQADLDNAQTTLDIVAMDPMAQGALGARLSATQDMNKARQAQGLAAYYFYQFEEEYKSGLKDKNLTAKCNLDASDLD